MIQARVRLFLAIALAVPAIGTAVTAQPQQNAPPPSSLAALAATHPKQQEFDTPAAAVEAFRTLLAADKFDAVADLLGLDSARLKAADGTMQSYADVREAAAEGIVLKDMGEGKVLELGKKLWPFPFPLTKDEKGKWAFDTQIGLEEILNRRVGENELEAIATLRAYVEAQRVYATVDRNRDGVLEYAQKLVSSAGRTDGLYWPSDQGDGESPAGDMVSTEALDKARRGEGYFGYHFRILTGQGDNVAGGRYDYIINGHMVAGFGLLAWPAKYDETGVHTFVVNQNGIVYETDLGPNTEAAARKIERFNPGARWNVVTE